MKNKLLLETVKKYCEDKNIKLTTHSYDWVLQLTSASIDKYIFGFRFPNNDGAVTELCNDKVALCEVLKSKNIEVVEHIPIFNIYDDEQRLHIIREFFKTSDEILCKDNKGTGGQNIYKVANEEEAMKYINTLLERDYMMALSPFHNIDIEYRAIVLNKKVKLVYGKKIPYVVGDGVKSIEELVKDKNIDVCKIDKNIDLNTVLQMGDKRNLCFTHNLGILGEVVTDINPETVQIVHHMALHTAEALDINFASIDIVKIGEEYKVLEVNSGVMMETYGGLSAENRQVVEKIYVEALDDICRER